MTSPCYPTILWITLMFYTFGSCNPFGVKFNNQTSLSVVFAREDGDIILGGLFPVHEKGGDVSACGEVNLDRGIQRLEAMLFTIDCINNNNKILPGIRLGANIFDTCGRATYALEQSLEFVRASMSALDESEFTCDDGSIAKPKNPLTAVAGVIGGSYSSTSIQVANLLRLFRIPQISYASTSAALSDKSRFDYFVRTVPPDTLQAKALVDIVQYFNWTYVSTVYSEGEYGENGIDYFEQEARKRNICIALSVKIASNSNRKTFEETVTRLKDKDRAKVIIAFVRVEDARGLLAAATNLSITDRFVWIAGDGWGVQDVQGENNKLVAEGALTIDLQSVPIPAFDSYFKNLSPSQNNRNPWFEEYWEKVHNCRFPNRANDKNLTGLFCTGNEKLTPTNYKQESKVQFIYDAVYAMAYALDRMQRDFCPNTTGICRRMEKINGEQLLKDYILNVSFEDGYGGLVKFDEKGDALGRYNIMNYRRDRGTNDYSYEKIGTWMNELVLDPDAIVWAGGTDEIPSSRCSEPCNFDERKRMQTGDTCCWICTKCQDHEFLKDEFTCEDCGDGKWPYPDMRSCFELDLQYMQWESIYAIVPICLSVAGTIATLIVIATFSMYKNTPIVMASGRELTYVLLCGCLFCYLMTFVQLAMPSPVVCALQRFGVGFGFSIIYSSLLTKTNRISRIFESARRSARRPPFISPRSQLVITGILISIQVVFTMIWLVLEPPGTRRYYPYGKRDEVILKCKVEDISFLVSLIYNMLLIIICTVYAVKTRRIPENFNESKFIGFAMYTTCIIWLAFVPIYFGTLNSFQIQITVLCVSISLSASVALVCLFTPKLYIIVFQPEKNVRKLNMNSATYKKGVSGCGSSSVASTMNHGVPPERIRLNVQSSPNRVGGHGTTDNETDRDSMASL